MREKRIVTEYGSVYYWVSDTWNYEKSRTYDEFDLEDTSDIIIKIMNENKVENIICVGQSFGGYHIRAFIAGYSEKVKAFVGIGTSPYDFVSLMRVRNVLWEDVVQGK